MNFQSLPSFRYGGDTSDKSGLIWYKETRYRPIYTSRTVIISKPRLTGDVES